ncbi:MAG: hypothetical protein AAGI15_15270 [Pseudomonadota bacterium]
MARPERPWLRGLLLLGALPLFAAETAYQLPPIPEPEGEERRIPLLERELAWFLERLQGTWDNQEQVSWAGDHQLPMPPRFYLRAEPLPAQALPGDVGAAVLVTQQRTANASRLWTINADEDAHALRIRTHALRRPVTLKDGATPELPRLRRRDLIDQPACEWLAYRDGDGFRLEAAGADGCADATVMPVRVLRDELWLPNNAAAAGLAGAAPTLRLERARWFACMLDVPPEPGARPTRTARYFTLYDQGGTLAFTHPDGRPMTLLMRNTWSYGMQRETFFIGVLDGSVTGPTLVYAWGEPGADRIGVNPGYLRVQCDRDTPRMRQAQHRLRPSS